MRLMGKIFKILGFESDERPKAVKKTKSKATYSLKKGKSTRPDQIDGVSVYYPEKHEQCKEFVAFVKQGRAVIISIEACSGEEGEKVIEYLKGFAFGSNSKYIVLNEDKLILILPEGMEVEE
jgi:FtsZ-interacting cell division protein YlmF